MLQKKTPPPTEKAKLHRRNQHRERYDFKLLTEACPSLAPFVFTNQFGSETVNFAEPEAVKALNQALLLCYYDIGFWDIPPGYLCPPIPGRADYIHHISDLMCGSNYGNMPSGPSVVCLDIGVGANCVYPIIGRKEYGWRFIGSEIDPVAQASAEAIVAQNDLLREHVQIRLQPNPKDVFYGVVQPEECIDLSICNPPFHASMADAEAGTLRKWSNLKGPDLPVLNFSGQSNELWCEGGESEFIRNMIKQSRQLTERVYWFSTLVSKESTLNGVYAALAKAQALDVKTIPMGQGNKKSRIVAWTFLEKAQQKAWKEQRWRRTKA
jgi:23S rRNA (adenine1618-N6)-methyltransferase